MLLLPDFFIFLVVSVVFLAIAVLVSLYKYTHVSQKLRLLEKQNEQLKQTEEARSVKALAKIHEQTEEIIQQANKKATDLVAEAKLFSTDEQGLIQHKLSHIVESQVEAFGKISDLLNKEYEDELQETKKEAIKIFTNTSKSIEETANKEITDFRTMMEDQTVNSQKVVNDKIDQAYKQVEVEIAEYKKTKFAEVDQAASQRMHEIATYVLGNGLTIDQQEILIQSALQELKKQSNS